MPTLKLHAYLAQTGVASRRAAEVMIADKLVSVNGELAHIGQRIDPEVDQIEVKGKSIQKPATPQYFLVYKPAGYVSTTHDELDRPTVLELIPDTGARLYPVGRLDADSEGLMLLTNDGEMAYQLTHPKFSMPKTYEVLINSPITDRAFDFLRKGAKLVDGWLIPSEVRLLPSAPKRQWLSITIDEGRKHVIRRLMRRAGYEVERLIRTELGPFTISDLSGQPYHRLSVSDVRERWDALNQPPELEELSPTDSPTPAESE